MQHTHDDAFGPQALASRSVALMACEVQTNWLHDQGCKQAMQASGIDSRSEGVVDLVVDVLGAVMGRGGRAAHAR